jgi:hypothetical protein
MFIPDPGSDFFPSRIHIKEFKYFNPKNSFLALGNKIRVVHPGSGSATLFEMLVFWQEVGEVPSKEAVDQLMVAKWRYSQTYSVASASEVEERQPLW